MPDCRVVDTMALIVTTFGGALSATLGVLVGGVVTRREQAIGAFLGAVATRDPVTDPVADPST